MSDIEVVEAALTDADLATLDALLEAGDDDAISAHLAKVMQRSDLRREASQMRERLYRDVILNVHHYLHLRDQESAMQLLCVAATLAEGELPPPEVLVAFTNVLNVANLERVKFDCEGSA